MVVPMGDQIRLSYRLLFPPRLAGATERPTVASIATLGSLSASSGSKMAMWSGSRPLLAMRARAATTPTHLGLGLFHKGAQELAGARITGLGERFRKQQALGPAPRPPRRTGDRTIPSAGPRPGWPVLRCAPRRPFSAAAACSCLIVSGSLRLTKRTRMSRRSIGRIGPARSISSIVCRSAGPGRRPDSASAGQRASGLPAWPGDSSEWRAASPRPRPRRCAGATRRCHCC